MKEFKEDIRNENRKQEVCNFLPNMYTANLASTNKDNVDLAIIFYVFDGENIYFKSRTTSAHSTNFNNNNNSSLNVYFEDSNHKSKYGIQLKGKVNQIFDENIMKKVVDLYEKNFEGSSLKLPSIKELCSKDINSTFYQFTINKFKIVDENSN